MIIASSVAVVVIVLLYVVLIRQSDLPYVEPLSPVAHLDERKSAIFENIRDANFEYLMGKLSPDDYQQTKNDLQKELADVNVEIEVVLTRLGSTEVAQVAAKRKTMSKPTAAPQAATAASVVPIVCPHCNATFATPMRFCGECGKPMEREGQ